MGGPRSGLRQPDGVYRVCGRRRRISCRACREDWSAWSDHATNTPTRLVSTGRGACLGTVEDIAPRSCSVRGIRWSPFCTPCEATLDGIFAAAAVQLGALALWSVHASHASALAISGGVVQLALAVRWAILRAHRRDLCIDLVVAGRGRLPLTALTREVRRLGDPRRSSQLAATLDDFAAFAMQQSSRRERPWPICSRAVLAAVEPQLRQVAARLRAGGVDLRGVALVERLVTSGCSPLYGEETGPLREELGARPLPAG